MDFEIVYLADVPELVPVCAQWAFNTWGKYNHAYTLDKRIESFTAHCNKDRIPLTIVALNSERVPIGMASLRPNDGIRPELTPWLGSVFVAPEFRRKGVASKLVRRMHEISHELGFEKIYLLTYEATLPQWYAKLGWTDIGTDVCHDNPVNVMDLDLARALV